MIKKALTLTVCVALLTGCAATSKQQEEQAKHKPVLSAIEVYRQDGAYSYRILRHCDGTTLLYVRDDYKSGMAVIPNSPVCGAK
jgi:hypothetical protein